MNYTPLLMQLNDAQRDAAACTEGPVMIIAGAGSGKTRTLTYRVAHLLEKGVDPFNILSLTFTNKAAAEMKERIMQLVGPEARNLWMGTFHSVFAKILRAEATKIGYISNFTIYDNDDSKKLIRDIVKSQNLDPKVYNAGYVLSRISMAKSSLISPVDYANNPEIQESDVAAHKPMIGQIYHIYNTRLRVAMAMDFDDLLFNTNVLLRDFPEVLLKYQNRFRYILVDEYQDTNFAQYLIVKKLAARHQNICVVGDDAQSIYAFRGANIQNIFNFKRDYPNVQLFKLEQNYRSTKTIVNAANAVISNNKEQIFKEIWTDNAQGNLINVLQCSDENDEGKQVVDAILQSHLGENRDYRDFAILYRTNRQSRALEEALRRENVPYRIYAGISFYGRKEIKDVLAYMRLAINNHDDESLERIINFPARGIGQTTFEKLKLAASDNGVSIWTVMEHLADFGLDINRGVANRINDFMLMIKLFTAKLYEVDAFELGEQIVRASGLINAYREDDDPEHQDRIDNVEELLSGIKDFVESEDTVTPEGYEEGNEEPQSDNKLRTLDMFLQQVLLFTSEDKEKDKDADKVSLMTIHAAKGLEFPYVFVVGMEENLFPSMLSISSRAELEEERRLFYVAVTRAEIQLTLSYAIMRNQYGNTSFQEVSRFLEEIDPIYLHQKRAPKKSSFPKAGSFPSAFGRKAASFDDNRPTFKKKESTTPAQSPSPLAPQHRNLKPVSKVSGPTMANSMEQINAIQVGQRVSHAKFGLGKVLNIEGSADSRKALIFFDTVGEKQLLLKFAKLTIVE